MTVYEVDYHLSQEPERMQSPAVDLTSASESDKGNA